MTNIKNSKNITYNFKIYNLFIPSKNIEFLYF